MWYVYASVDAVYSAITSDLGYEGSKKSQKLNKQEYQDQGLAAQAKTNLSKLSVSLLSPPSRRRNPL
jgi:hypothetical protein